ncbi:MAG TPA: hypothetical protein VMH28_07045 [Candidatus Acidoferrales bacterium]|nr:hypothetical protein [Candidatus Acidoferrales bacterium]
MESERPLRVFPVLVRHFFGRFFDKESLSPQGEPEAGVIQTLGILAAPEAFFVLLFRPLTFTGWDLVAVRYLFVSFSMIVMGFIMVFEWDALFPDRRDYQVLTPQPLRLSAIFLAKTAALAVFLGMFLADVNFFGVLFWPGIDARPGLISNLGSHLVAVAAGGLFSALAFAALQGVLVTFLRGNLYRRVSVFLQTLLMAVLVMLLFLSPLAAGRLHWLEANHPNYLYWFPGFWFMGLYEGLRPATHSAVLRDLGGVAWRGLAWAAAVFVLTYLPGYRGHSRRVLEAPAPGAAGPGRARVWSGAILRRTLLRRPVELAVFRFITQTITRSMKHRLFLATYGGFGAAMAVVALASGRSGLFELPLTLSFILVSGLRAAFNFPSELAANWGFQITETGGIEPYLAATRKWIVLCAVLPLFVLMAPMELARFHWTAALFHAAYGIMLAVVLMEVMFLGFRKVPFTCAHFPGKVNLVFLSVMYVFGFTTYSGTMARLEAWLAVRPAAALLFLAAAAAGWIAVSRYGRRVLGAKAVLDYEDPADPVVRTLGIAVR